MPSRSAAAISAPSSPYSAADISAFCALALSGSISKRAVAVIALPVEGTVKVAVSSLAVISMAVPSISSTFQPVSIYLSPGAAVRVTVSFS